MGFGIVLLLAVAGIWFTAHYQPKIKVEAYKKFLREHGEKLNIAEVTPLPVSVESNSVAAVQKAFAMFGSDSENVPNAMKMVAPGAALVGWMQPDVRGYDFTNSWHDFSSHVAFDRPALAHLHQVLERPSLDFQMDYQKGISLLLPHLVPLKKAVQKLTSASILDLHDGNTGEAATNILTMLALVRKSANEGLLISHLVRLAMTSIAVVPSWELLQNTNVTDSQLAALQTGWEQLDFLGDATNAFVFERAWGLDELQKLRTQPDEMGKIFGSGGSSSFGSLWSWPPDWEAITVTPRYAIGKAMWCASWSYSDELQTMKSEQVILEALRAMSTNWNGCLKTDYDAMQSQLSRLGLTNFAPSRTFFHALKIPDFSELAGDGGLSATVGKTIRIEAARRMVVTAIALKRFQLKHGSWPQSLSKLTPEFFASVPIDPYDGKSLRYHVNEDGSFLLYCVGEDGVDNGGDPNFLPGVTSTSLYWQSPKARDWVWPQPATEAEIEKYFADQAKKSD